MHRNRAQELGNECIRYTELSTRILAVMALKKNRLIETTVVLLLWLMALALIYLVYLKLKLFFHK